MLPKVYEPKKIEEKIYKIWLKSGFFNPDKLPGKRTKVFSLMMAPPNITGSLHMGHALENTSSDIVARFKRMRGYKTLWAPGIDHAGIATQNAVEKELRKEGLRRQDLGREKFIERVWQWKEKYGGIILDQLKKLGASADWSRARFTLDPGYVKAVQTAFIHYYNKGYIYRGERIINWCPRCGTSISDLEIEYRAEKGKLYFIKYPLAQEPEGFIVVATTRPETMLGDAAVAVNPKDKRYEELAGQNVELPLVNREIPIVADSAVDMNFGTGAVKVTPAHDTLDFEIANRHNLPFHKIIDENRKMRGDIPEFCKRTSALECRKKVIEELKNLNFIEKIEDYEHNVGHCARCDSVIEPMLSKQWFVKMQPLARLALDAVKKKETKIYPKRWEKSYFAWLKNVRDWNISRQLWWGHQLPVWFHEPKCLPRLGHEKKLDKCKEFIVSITEPKCKYCDAKFVRSEEVLDTWFSSALWPFAILGWPGETRDLKTFYPADFITSDRGILHLWITRMIFSGKEFARKSPFKLAYIHATILTKEGKRMSKSLGTGIDPLVLMEKYGTDATRFGLIWQDTGNQDIRFGEESIIAGKKFANKIWNAARFITLKVSPKKIAYKPPAPGLTQADKNILKKLGRVEKNTFKNIEALKLSLALREIYDFFWHSFADIYIEKIKNQKGKAQDQTLIYVFGQTLKLLHPFMPFITEEIWNNITKNYEISKNLIIVESI